MKKTIVAGTILTSLFLGEKAASAAEYMVQSGDSLWKIAKTFQMSVSELKAYNKLTSDTIFVGQVLQIPEKTTIQMSAQPPQPTTTYTVQSGDSLSLIASKFNTTVTRLLELNPTITNPNVIRVGQVLNVRAGQAFNAPLSWQQKANAIIETGKKYLGAKYLFGAPVTRTDVFDCSSFTYRVYQENGITLPRTSREQAMIGTEIPLSNIRTGDLIFFDTNGDGIINHVSIVVDSETLLHATTSTGVAFSNMKPYWAPRAMKAVRVF
jgi:peptidoglycan endopeptidase LytE